MSDLIRVVDLEVWSRIGVPEEERAQPQRLLVTLEMETAGFNRAAAQDDINQTVDYFQVTQRCKSFAGAKPRKLLEMFAEDLARELLDVFPLKKIRLEIKKFILPDARYISVKLERPN